LFVAWSGEVLNCHPQQVQPASDDDIGTTGAECQFGKGGHNQIRFSRPNLQAECLQQIVKTSSGIGKAVQAKRLATAVVESHSPGGGGAIKNYGTANEAPITDLVPLATDVHDLYGVDRDWHAWFPRSARRLPAIEEL
jgi:hypothetical protein